MISMGVQWQFNESSMSSIGFQREFNEFKDYPISFNFLNPIFPNTSVNFFR